MEKDELKMLEQFRAMIPVFGNKELIGFDLVLSGFSMVLGHTDANLFVMRKEVKARQIELAKTPTKKNTLIKQLAEIEAAETKMLTDQ